MGSGIFQGWSESIDLSMETPQLATDQSAVDDMMKELSQVHDDEVGEEEVQFEVSKVQEVRAAMGIVCRALIDSKELVAFSKFERMIELKHA